jgi:MFS family permease
MLVLVAALLVLAADEAGYPLTAWAPVALLALALVAVAVVAVGLPPRPAPAVALALGLMAAYTAWTYLSILWAERQDAALDGANRTLLYLLILSVFACWPVTPRAGRLLLAVLGLGIAALGLVELVRVHLSDQPLGFFIEGRLVEPAGYVNANVAVWTIGLLACLAVAVDRASPVVLRGAALGGSGVLAAMALLGQSRGWLLALPVGIALFVIAAPSRSRALGAVLGVAAMTGIVSSRLLAVHDDFAPSRLDDLVANALAATVTSAVVLGAAGTAFALIDRRRAKEPDRPRRSRRAPRGRTLAALGAGALVAIVAVLAVAGAPSRASDAWDDFKQGGQPESGSSRFTSVGTYRYDFWRVAWQLFEDHPVAGIGVENYQEEYLRRGDSFEQPRYAHSLELGVLSQTGLIGALLLFGAIGSALVAAVARRRRAGPALAWVSAGALGIFGYWLVHASVDWLWEFPAIGGAAFAALGLACAPAVPAEQGARRPVPRPAAVATGAILLALAVIVCGPFLAERETQRALDSWRADPGAAFDRLDRAKTLNPLSARPNLVAGAIAVKLDRLRRADVEFRGALEREPDDAYALLELGALAAQRGDRDRALALLRRARALRPRDEPVRYALEQVRNRRPLTVSEVDARILERARSRLQRAP